MYHIDFYSYKEQQADYERRIKKDYVWKAIDELQTLENKLEHKDKKLLRIINRLQEYLS
jgi:hypothetical protein